MISLQVIVPEGSVLTTTAEEVIVPGVLGEFGVLPGHIPLLSAVKAGVLRYRQNSALHNVAVGKGFANVGQNDRVTILTEEGLLPANIDEAAAQKKLADSEAKLRDWTGPINNEYEELNEAVAWARAQIEAKHA